MMNYAIKSLTFAALALSLSGCTNMSLFKDSQSEATRMPAENQMTMAPGALPASEIRSLLSGKSWRWQGPNNSGVTLFASDGTSLVEVTGKGTTTGKWIAKDGELCESVAPAKFIPQGAPMTCRPMTGANGQYKVGTAVFTLSS
jgi:hypothetical protein